MKITAIKRQIKNASRFAVFIDGNYKFSLSDNELLRSGLVPNQELTEDQLDELLERAKIDKAFNQTLNMIARRPHSEWELRNYLKRKEYEKEVIDQVIIKLTEYKYVDDLSFATQWVESRRLLKATSRRRLEQELRQKHIAAETIERVLADDSTDELQVLKDLINKKRQRYPDKLKLMQYLSRQGYNYHDIKSALEDSEA